MTAAPDAVDAAQEALWAARRELGEVLVTARQSGANIKAIAQAARRPDIDISNALATRGISRTWRAWPQHRDERALQAIKPLKC